MSLGFVIVLDKDVAGVDPRDIDGRALAAERHTLDAIAHEVDLPGLCEFVAFSHAEAEALAEDMKFDAPTTGSASGRWFACASAIPVVRAILGSLRDEPEEVYEPQAVVDALKGLQAVLEAADAAGARFRLSLDY